MSSFCRPFLLVSVIGLHVGSAFAADHIPYEPRHSGSGLFWENDWLLSPIGLEQDDQNYTMGISWQTSGSRIREWLISAPYRWIDNQMQRSAVLNRLRIDDSDALATSHSMEVGVSAFTPDNLGAREPVHDDRPYASLLFLNTQRRAVSTNDKVAKTTELSLGIYGLSLAKGFQRGVHRMRQKDGKPVIPEGWDNQISDGGELTARIGSRYQRKVLCETHYDLQLVGQLNAGYYTNVGAGTALRLGKISSYWWDFDATKISESSFLKSRHLPESNKPCDTRLLDGREAYVYAGANATAWAYNGMLQGQFKSSAATVPSRDFERVVYDFTIGGAIGYPTENRVHRISVAFSRRSREAGFSSARSHQWGGIYYSTVRKCSAASPDRC